MNKQILHKLVTTSNASGNDNVIKDIFCVDIFVVVFIKYFLMFN